MRYSPSTGGFYHAAINGANIPLDAVEITAEQHAGLLEGQAAGQRIIADENGFPVLADYPAPTDEQLSSHARTERNALLSACDWTVLSDAPLTEPEKAAWIEYRQDLRDVPDQAGFPQNIVWPSSP